MPYDPPPELAGLSLAEIARAVETRKVPPLDQWAPAQTGDSEMRIAANGRWYHQGGEITRPAMLRAFSSLLKREADGSHWLVTPYERLSIEVEDAAFIATDMEAKVDASGCPVLTFRLNTDDIVVCGPDNPLRVAGTADTPAFYVAVRHGVEARLNRSTYGQLIDHALSTNADGPLAVESLGATFPLVPAE